MLPDACHEKKKAHTERRIMITKLRYGNTNTFLITGDSGTLLVDTDYAGTMPAFYKAIKTIGIKVSDFTYVLATHYHPDHMGLISELMDRGVQLLVMETQKDAIHDSDRIFEKDPSLGYRPIDGDRAQILSFEDSRTFLARLGIAGCIIPLKSHSADSIAVLLDDGTFLVGDLEPLAYLEAYEDNRALRADWDTLLRLHPRRILHAHANEKNFPAQQTQPAL